MMERKKDELRGNVLRKLRKERNLTQQQVAVYLSLSKQAISQFENGMAYSLETASAFSEFYNVDLDYLMFSSKKVRIQRVLLDRMMERKEIVDAVLLHLEPKIDALEKRVEEFEVLLKNKK